MKQEQKAECDGCKTPVAEGKDCPHCGLYMPDGGQLADEGQAQGERNLREADERGDSE